MEFLIFRIAGNLYDFHTVQQRPWDGLGGIGGGNKQNLRQVHGNFHIMVPELGILRPVQHL